MSVNKYVDLISNFYVALSKKYSLITNFTNNKDRFSCHVALSYVDCMKNHS